MGYIIALFLLAASFHFCLSDEFCPASSIISPCQCDGEGINCMKVRTDAELQKIFAAIPKPWKFRGVWLQTTGTTILPTGMFKGIEVQAFHIEINDIHTVQNGAFNGSEKSCYSLSLFGNKVDKFPEAIKSLSNLRTLNLGRNKLTSIPADAFSGNKFLMQIVMPENKISHIGPGAFKGLPFLVRLDLLHNQMPMLGPSALAMDSQNPTLTVNLANCSISNIAPTAFTGMNPQHLNLALNRLQHLEESAFLPMVKKMATRGGQIELAGNPLSCMGCSYRWVVINSATLRNVMPSFRCTDGRTLQTLSLLNIMCMFPGATNIFQKI